MNSPDEKYDLVIVGGGLVGTSLAVALAPIGLSIAVIEAATPPSTNSVDRDGRHLALAQGSKRILDAIGVWPDITRRGATPIKRIHISDRGHGGFTRLDRSRLGVDAMGYVVSALLLGSVLIDALNRHAPTQLLCPAKVTGLAVHKERVEITVQQRESVSKLLTPLVVLADGGDSHTRELAGISARRNNYHQTAIVTTVTTDRPHNGTAYERFTNTGPLAFLPIEDQGYAVVWTARDEQVADLLDLDDEAFLLQLQDRFGWRAGQLSQLGSRHTHPLSLVTVPDPVYPRVVVIGNAAHTIHPVAGQGFNLGVRDVATLTEVLRRAQGLGADLGDLSVLKDYAEWRRRDTRAVGVFTDGLIRLFANDFLPAAAARNLMMLAVDSLPFAKRFLARRTMGLAGHLPPLACGIPVTRA